MPRPGLSQIASRSILEKLETQQEWTEGDQELSRERQVNKKSIG